LSFLHLPISVNILVSGPQWPISARPSHISLPEEDVDFDEKMERFERHLILHAYEKSDRVKARTAKMLGIDRNRLRYKLKKYGIDD
jgi:DNA-binding NtrC family response regulator